MNGTSPAPPLAYYGPGSPGSAWRVGNRLLATPDGDGVIRLPPFCVTCGTPTPVGHAYRETYRWSHPLFWAVGVLPPFWLPCALLYLPLSRLVAVRVPRCARHCELASRPVAGVRIGLRWSASLTAVAAPVGLVGLLPVPWLHEHARPAAIFCLDGGIVLLMLLAVAHTFVRPRLRVTRADAAAVRFARVGPAFLARLPLG